MLVTIDTSCHDCIMRKTHMFMPAISTYSNIYMGCGERRDAYQLEKNYPVLCLGAHHKGVGEPP